MRLGTQNSYCIPIRWVCIHGGVDPVKGPFLLLPGDALLGHALCGFDNTTDLISLNLSLPTYQLGPIGAHRFSGCINELISASGPGPWW